MGEEEEAQTHYQLHAHVIRDAVVCEKSPLEVDVGVLAGLKHFVFTFPPVINIHAMW